MGLRRWGDYYQALANHLGLKIDRIEAIQKINGIEGRILDSGPAGYQDYYPALFGGVLALKPHPGRIEVEQLFNFDLKRTLEEHFTLVYSGDTRLSGINNWEVYKAFFNKEAHVRLGLVKIAELSNEAYLAIKNKNFEALPRFVAMEGSERKKLFPGIMTPAMNKLQESLGDKIFGIKVCGAGGGGCFLITHPKESRALVESKVKEMGMTQLAFIVEPPLT